MSALCNSRVSDGKGRKPKKLRRPEQGNKPSLIHRDLCNTNPQTSNHFSPRQTRERFRARLKRCTIGYGHDLPTQHRYLNATLAEWYDLPTNHPAASTPDRAAILCFHLATANHSVLVDAAAYAFPPDFESMVIPGEQRPGLKDQLLTLGIEADDITDLVITHPHVDHINGLTKFVDGQHLPLFPKARHYLGAADWRPETFGSLEQDTLKVIEAWGLLKLVSGKLELGDGLSIVPMPR